MWQRSEDVTVVGPIRIVKVTGPNRHLSCSRPQTYNAGFKQGNETMIRNATKTSFKNCTAAILIAGFCLCSATGCQVSLNGQTLPSPYYLQDDVQYYPSGPEFKLPREAAALSAARAQEKLDRR